MKSTSTDLKLILSVIKKILKSRSLSYQKVAEGLGVSEVSIKRIFSGDTISLKNLLLICDLLNVSFLDIATIAKENSTTEYLLNKRQDDFFSEHPRLYALFIDLYRRTSPIKVKEYWNLTETEYFKILRNYEKLDLLTLYPGNHFKFNMTGIIKIPSSGRLKKLFFKHNLEFLTHVQVHAQTPGYLIQTSEILLSHENIKSLTRDLEDLSQKYRSKAFTDETVLPEQDKKSIRLLVAMAPYQTDWRQC